MVSVADIAIAVLTSVVLPQEGCTVDLLSRHLEGVQNIQYQHIHMCCGCALNFNFISLLLLTRCV